MSEDRVKVLYIAGAGRSGTTLLDVLLGGLDGFFSAGEMRWLWWAFIDGWQCGCTKKVRDCEVWKEILETGFRDGPGGLDVERNLRLQQEVVRLHQLPRLLTQRPGSRPRWSKLQSYMDVAQRLYEGIARVTGARVIVDSSKNAPEAALLLLLANVEPYLIQLVRDPRGVANSMKRQVRMEPFAEKTFNQPVHGSAVSSLIWARKNLAADVARLRYPLARTRLVRYEDLVRDPKRTLKGIASFVGEPFTGLEFSGARTVELRGNHTAWGNPSRFRTGVVELRPDDAWLAQLPRRDKMVTTTVSLPLLLKYRYAELLRRKSTKR